MTQINVVQVHHPSSIYSGGDSKYNKQADKSNEGNTNEANIEYSVRCMFSKQILMLTALINATSKKAFNDDVSMVPH